MKSIWNKSVSVPHFESLKKDIEAEAVIVGGGMAGLLIAYKLKEKGFDAVVLEAAEICSGQTANTTAKITCQHGLHTADALVLKKLKSPSKSASQLKNGEGDIVRYNSKTVAAYRDENGIVHAVSPNCSHLGCRLSFNSELKSRDCPCHGSRFDVDGKVIDNPALKNLKKY